MNLIVQLYVFHRDEQNWLFLKSKPPISVPILIDNDAFLVAHY
jgi:hypothetical protein